MTTLSDSIDMICGLLTKVQRNIETKPDYYRPIYNVYYMVIYAAIQDSFNYGKVKSKSKNRRDYRHRNKKSQQQRTEARRWLLESKDCKLMWHNIADVSYEIFQQILSDAYRSFAKECGDRSEWNRHNAKSIEIGRRLKGLSL